MLNWSDTVDEMNLSAVEAMGRVRAVLAATHPQAAEIVTSQVALELELRALHQARCGASQHKRKLKVVDRQLRESGADAWTCLVLDAMGAFTDLRNSIAHGDEPAALRVAITKLADKVEHIGPRINPSTVHYGTVAMSLAAALRVGFGGKDADGAARR
jgi:hypothetical protein